MASLLPKQIMLSDIEKCIVEISSKLSGRTTREYLAIWIGRYLVDNEATSVYGMEQHELYRISQFALPAR